MVVSSVDLDGGVDARLRLPEVRTEGGEVVARRSFLRRVPVDHSRSRNAARRGDRPPPLTRAAAEDLPDRRERDLLVLEGALEILSSPDERPGRMVELRAFAALGVRWIAEALGLSMAPADRNRASARARLHLPLGEA